MACVCVCVCVCWLMTEYTDVTSSEALPLGTYFQEHVRSLVQYNADEVDQQLALLRNVVRQLRCVTAIILPYAYRHHHHHHE